jgi:hypothetical protein
MSIETRLDAVGDRLVDEDVREATEVGLAATAGMVSDHFTSNS